MYLNIFHRFLGLQIAIKIARICIWQKFKIKKRKEIFFSHLRKKNSSQTKRITLLFFFKLCFFHAFLYIFQVISNKRIQNIPRCYCYSIIFHRLFPVSIIAFIHESMEKKKSDKILLSRERKKKLFVTKLIHHSFFTVKFSHQFISVP